MLFYSKVFVKEIFNGKSFLRNYLDTSCFLLFHSWLKVLTVFVQSKQELERKKIKNFDRIVNIIEQFKKCIHLFQANFVFILFFSTPKDRAIDFIASISLPFLNKIWLKQISWSAVLKLIISVCFLFFWVSSRALFPFLSLLFSIDWFDKRYSCLTILNYNIKMDTQQEEIEKIL